LDLCGKLDKLKQPSARSKCDALVENVFYQMFTVAKYGPTGATDGFSKLPTEKD
jgi:hypothetical protein